MDIPVQELFAPPGASGRTLASYVERSGRVEAIWFPFTANPWLKVWTPTPSKPLLARPVFAPYNYPFSDNIPSQVAQLAAQIIAGNVAVTPLFTQAQYAVIAAGLLATLSADLWGWSKDLLLYVKPTTLRVTANGYAILTRRSEIQRVVYEFVEHYRSRLAAYQALGRYPMNGAIEIRVTGLDSLADVAVAAAGAPVLSALHPRPDHPEWDVAVWLDLLTLPGTPYANEFYTEIEAWIFANYAGSYAAVRPEWSKGWAYTSRGAWTDSTMLEATIPNAHRAGRASDDSWDWAVETLNRYDPQRVFSTAFLSRLLPP